MTGLPTGLGTASHRRSGRAFVHVRSGALQVGRGLLAGAPVGLKLVGNLLTLSEAAHACALDGADVHEHVLAALIGLNEAVALLFVEPLHGPSRHSRSFSLHSAFNPQIGRWLAC